MLESSLCNSLIKAPSVADFIQSMGLVVISIERMKSAPEVAGGTCFYC